MSEELIPETPPTEPVVEVPVVEKVERAKYSDVQTAKNTPLKDFIPHETFVIKDLIEKAREEGFITVFLGSDKQTINRSDEIIGKWLAARSATIMLRDEEITPAQAQTRINDWDEMMEEHFPGVDETAINKMCSDLFMFMENLRDDVKMRSRVMVEDNITDMLDRGSNIKTPLIIGRKPTVATNKELTISAIMRRTAARSTNDFYNFDLNLSNSFVRLVIKRPTVLEMGSLIQDIMKEIKGYVRTLKTSSVVLAQVAGMKVIWRFIADRIIECSVKDTSDFEKLSKSILITDFDELCVGLLQSIYTRGVNMDLRCLHEGCNWADFKLTDPAKLIKLRHSTFSDEEFAVFGNVMNGVRSYSREELAKVVSKTNYGLETNRVYNKEESYYFEISPPTLSHAFQTFDYFVSEVNPRIQELRVNVLDEEEFEQNLNVLLSSLNSSEFIHWIGGYCTVPEPGTDEKPVLITRTDENCTEFNAGLMDILNDDQEIGRRLVNFIYNKSPAMSHTFCGVANFECPHCAEKSNTADKRNFGFTPVNAFMTFFTLAQLKLMNHATGTAGAADEAP